MTIHFVCRGNTYRSRLADTYLNSKKLNNIKAISSGIEADKNISGSITWYDQRIIQQNHLQSFEKPMWQDTTKELLETSDLNVFMKKDIYDFCVNNLGFSGNNFQVWDISDMNEVGKTEEDLIKESEQTFVAIKAKVDELILSLQSASGKI